MGIIYETILLEIRMNIEIIIIMNMKCCVYCFFGLAKTFVVQTLGCFIRGINVPVLGIAYI